MALCLAIVRLESLTAIIGASADAKLGRAGHGPQPAKSGKPSTAGLT
jgi:hypothetical protein